MIRSRGSPSVRTFDQEPLADTGGLPVAQIKILRRPKPIPNESPLEPSHMSSSNPRNKSWYSHQNEGISNQSDNDIRPQTTRLALDEEQWPSIADAAKCLGSQNCTQKPIATTQSTSDRPIRTTTTVLKIATRDQLRSSAQSLHSSSSADNNRPPLKSYKERADEYAKARLRILGSAFAEDESNNHHDYHHHHQALR